MGLKVFFILTKLSMVSASCLILPEVPHATHNVTSQPPYVSGMVAHFECDIAVNPAGTSKDYVCSGSSWTQGDLKCEEMYCKYIPSPENGRIANEQTRQVGSSISFQCNSGYTLAGPSQMTCRADFEWSPPDPPTCQIVMCPDFGSVEHGSIFQDTCTSYTVMNGYGSIVKVTCDWGYILEGSPNVKCQASGEWEQKPVCKKSECPPYPGFNSSCIASTQLVLNDQFMFIICMTGEDVSVTKEGPDSVECVNQQWDFSKGVINCYCDCRVKADPKVSMQNLDSKGFLKHGKTLHWSCESNWVKDTDDPVVCLDGKYRVPVCKPRPTPPSTQQPETDSKGSIVTGATQQPKTDSEGNIVTDSPDGEEEGLSGWKIFDQCTCSKDLLEVQKQLLLESRKRNSLLAEISSRLARLIKIKKRKLQLLKGQQERDRKKNKELHGGHI